MKKRENFLSSYWVAPISLILFMFILILIFRENGLIFLFIAMQAFATLLFLAWKAKSKKKSIFNGYIFLLLLIGLILLVNYTNHSRYTDSGREIYSWVVLGGPILITAYISASIENKGKYSMIFNFLKILLFGAISFVVSMGLFMD